MRRLSAAARLYIAFTALAGSAVLVGSLWNWRPEYSLRAAFYLLGAVLASQLKVRLPGVTGTLSMNFLFVLIGVIEAGLPETLILACAGMAAQILSNTKARPSPAQVLFNLSSVTLAAASAWATFHARWLVRLDGSLPVLLFFATAAYFFANTTSVSMIIALTENKKPVAVWRQGFLWTAPEHLVGAALAAAFHFANQYVGWQVALLTAPSAYLVYRSYHLYLHRLEEERKHATSIAEMHWRTIEALALAIDAKDNTTHDHLQRVRVYATEIARDLGLGETQQKALEIAPLLHDIGKLAVPEHILSKPARLTPDEFEVMKIHPAVGAAILERVGFPYPVVPIVRAHHEKWDGSGYTSGLRGEEIPIGARILAAVDCLDALASPRQYRRALPLDEAMEKVVSESGRSFDPRVVEILRGRYLELENLARSTPVASAHPALDPKCVAGGAPGAGYEIGATSPDGEAAASEPDPVMETARREFQSLLDLTGEVGARLTRDEIFSLIAALLARLVPHHALAIYVCRNRILVPEYVAGEECGLLSSLRIPYGRGVSGWVVEKRKPVINGDPSVESHYLAEPWQFCGLHAALSVPLEGPSGTLGALAVYHRAADHFRRENLRLLLSLNTLIGQIVHEAVRADRGNGSASDTIPARESMVLHLERELGRSRRTGAPIAVLTLELEDLDEVGAQFGALMEERVMQAVLSQLRRSCREYDYVCRPEHHLLVMVVPGLSREGAHNSLPELETFALQAAGIVCPGGRIAAKIAVAAFPEDGETTEELLAGVERRLSPDFATQEAH
jgi:putative nucleotidyltransferase with HDIG domain